MEQQQISATESAAVSSFMTRAANVFMSPGELYTEVASAPVQNSSWVIPYVLTILVGILITIAIFTNQSLQDQVLAPQREEIQKQVEQGKMTQEQADKAGSFMTPTMFMTFGIAGVFGIVTATIFLVPLVLFLVVKVAFKYSGTYKKLLESYGLALLIGEVGALVALLLMYSMDSMLAQPSGAMFLKDSFDRHSFTHNFIASLNIFTLWETAVVGIALSKLTGKSTGAGMAVAYGLWLAWTIISSLLGWGLR